MSYRGWYVKNSEETMDFKDAIPDFMIKNDPNSKSKEEDKQ